MRKLYLSLLLLLSAPMSRAASDEANALQLHAASGDLTILLDERPVVTFSDDSFVLRTHMASLSMPASLVTGFTYVKSDDATGTPRLGGSGSFLSLSGGRLSMSGLAPSSSVQVYSADGALLSTARADGKGGISLSLPAMGAGAVYVVKTSGVNFKIRKP